MNHNSTRILRYFENELQLVGNGIGGEYGLNDIASFFIDGEGQLYTFKGKSAFRLQ